MEQETPSASTSLPKVPESPEKAAAEYPTWWRRAWIPFVVLLLAAAVGDMLAPRASLLPGGELMFGLGPAVGGVLLMLAILLLRRDMARSEMVLLSLLALSCGVALAVSGSFFCWVMVWMVPLLWLSVLPSSKSDWVKDKKYYNWWNYWFSAQRADRLSFLTRLLPWIVSVLVGIVLFILFLCIFASGNPVVELIWNHITDAWNRLVAFLRIDWDFALHVLFWVVGIVLFGVYTMRRNRAAEPVAVSAEVVPGRSILPQLPLMILLGINLAFMIVNASDMAYLWFRRVPEGVSQTQYLHEGADSIIWASIIASVILIILFRAAGRARCGVMTRGLGYLLVVQTMLLAGSVFLRLYYQIDDFGFTVRRIVAGEMMLFGVLGLVVLLGYMVSGKFLCCLGRGLAAALVLLALTQVNPPSSLAGDLNMRYGASLVGVLDDSAPKYAKRGWKFSRSDFSSRVPMARNLTFALYVYDRSKDTLSPEERKAFRESMVSVAHNVEKRASAEGWFHWNWLTYRDIPAAERLLGRPIAVKEVQETH